MLSARVGGLTNLAWQQAFILGGICTIIILGIHLYKKVILDRLMLGVNLFLLVGAFAFLSDTSSILYYFGTYKGAVFLSCIAIVGLVTTFFSHAGFIGIKTNNAKMIRKSSLQLLFFTIISIIWSLITNNYGLLTSAVIPFIILRTIYAKLGNELKK
jgi:hypothetical protein